ncbi:biotin transporter BioY [Vacuolonema iberomarrocanum]|uniref:biotin transporter BioY n=1 Tax=Vacuolonema iberomarrocanum TaxID=3454632 RepID=UPI0019F86952|nr:biotin transporter BioY [filamentous cyanobacterium LEGE 07170]
MVYTYADQIFRPQDRDRTWLYNTLLILGGSLFIAGAAQIAIPLLPFSPVPITGQTFAVLLVGAALGSKRGALCVLTYLTQGAVGLPVFTGAGAGIATLAGPTGGYLIGFMFAAYLTGWLAERGWDRRLQTNFLAMLLGNLVLYTFGLAWLGVLVGYDKVLALGLWPFIPGDLLKLAIATGLLPFAWKLARPRG